MMRMLRIVSRLAWRNLWRNHRRTVIMLSAVGVGVWAMIFMTALIQGMTDEMIKDGISALPGHVQVHHPDFPDDPNVDNAIPLPDAELAARFEAAGVARWATRVRVPAVVMSEYESRGVTLLGIDPAAERGFTFIDRSEITGRFLEDPQDDGIVIGRKLAETLDTGIGKRVVLMSQDPDNVIADRGFRVAGLFDANIESFETRYVFAGKRTIQSLLGIGDHVTEAIARGDDYRDVSALYAKVSDAMGDSLSVRRWFEIDRYLDAMLSVMDGFVLVWMFVIFISLSFGLVNTLMMAVFERVREIGLMLALGMKPASIVAEIIVESMLLLVIGVAVGNVLAFATITPLESGIDISIVAEGMEMMGHASVLYPKLRLEDVLLANGIVLILGLLASVSPAWRASRYEPVEAIMRTE